MTSNLLKEKREFLIFLLENYLKNDEEMYWFFNYLLSEDHLLNQMKLVEQGKKAPRSLILEEKEEGIFLSVCLYQQVLYDLPTLFHELRFHPEKEWFLETNILALKHLPSYLGSLEDNPYATYNSQVDKKIQLEIANYFKNEEEIFALANLKEKMNEALDKNNQEAFYKLQEIYKDKLLRQKEDD